MSAIPNQLLVLVTGANGFIGSHVADQFLAAGYRVRCTVRSESKGAWVKELFDKKYGPNKFEIAIVPDMSEHGAFNDAMEGKVLLLHLLQRELLTQYRCNGSSPRRNQSSLQSRSRETQFPRSIRRHPSLSSSQIYTHYQYIPDDLVTTSTDNPQSHRHNNPHPRIGSRQTKHHPLRPNVLLHSSHEPETQPQFHHHGQDMEPRSHRRGIRTTSLHRRAQMGCLRR